MLNHMRNPSLWWLALAPLLLLSGVGGGTFILLDQVLNTAGEVSFTVPSVRTFEVEKPGTYVLSHDFKVVFNGRPYSNQPTLPEGTLISLKGPAGYVQMDPSWHSSITSEAHERQETGRFRLYEPGDYTLSVTGLNGQHVLTFGRSNLLGIVAAAAICIILNLAGWFGAPALVITILVMRLRHKRYLSSLKPGT